MSTVHAASHARSWSKLNVQFRHTAMWSADTDYYPNPFMYSNSKGRPTCECHSATSSNPFLMPDQTSLATAPQHKSRSPLPTSSYELVHLLTDARATTPNQHSPGMRWLSLARAEAKTSLLSTTHSSTRSLASTIAHDTYLAGWWQGTVDRLVNIDLSHLLQTLRHSTGRKLSVAPTFERKWLCER